MYMVSDKLQTLSENDKYTLKAKIIQGRLRIQLCVYDFQPETQKKQLIKKFAKLVMLGYSMNLRQKFTNIHKVFEHMKENRSGYSVNYKEGKIHLLEVLESGRKKLIDTIQLEQQQIPNMSKYQDEQQVFKERIKKPTNPLQELLTDNQIQINSAENTNPFFNLDKYNQVQEKGQNDINGEEDRQIRSVNNYQLQRQWEQSKRMKKMMKGKMKQMQIQIKYLRDVVMERETKLWKAIERISNLQKAYDNQNRYLTRTIEEMCVKMKQLAQNVERNSEIIECMNEFQQVQDCQQQKGKYDELFQFEKDKVFIKNNKIKLLQNGLTILFGKKRIPEKLEMKVEIRALKDLFGIGIAEHSYKNSSDLFMKKNLIVLDTNGNVHYMGKFSKQQMVTFPKKQERVFSITVNVKELKIEWKVGDKVILVVQHCDTLGDPSIFWVPLIMLYNKNDCISIS